MKRPRSNLPFQILTFLVLPSLILVLLVAIGGVALHQSAMRDMILDHNLHAARGSAASLSHELSEREDVLRSLIGRVNDQQPVEHIAADLDSWVLTLFNGGIAFYDSSGDLLAATGQADPDVPVDAIHQAILSGRPVSYLALLSTPDDGTDVAIVVVDETARLVVGGISSLGDLGLDEVLESLHPDSATIVMIVDPDRQILYHSDPTQIGRYLSDTPVTSTLLSKPSGAEYIMRQHEGDTVATYARIEEPGWVLVQEEEWRRSLDLLTRYSQAAPLVLVPGLLIAAAAVWFGLRRIVQPLQQLETRASDLAWGDFESIEKPVGGIQEIQQLQATLRHLASRVRSTQAGMRSYIAAITQTQEDERARLARELHDQTVQSLIALGHREQRLKRLVDDPKAVEILNDLRSMTTQAVDDLRRVIRAMRPIYLEELGLVPALEMLARDLDLDERAVRVRFERQGEPQRMPPENEMALYRIAQEALSNIWHHSEASQAWLMVRFSDSSVTLSVRDNGKGFTAPRRVTDLSEEGHFGVMGMYERAALIGAHLSIESEQGKGTTITVRMNLAAPSETLSDEEEVSRTDAFSVTPPGPPAAEAER
jgi:signal transduction histidine kinase